MSLFGLAELLIALTAIYKVSFLLAPFNFEKIILYAQCNSI